MKIAMFEQFTDQMKLNKTYKVLNFQLVTYLNKRKMRSTILTKFEKINMDIPDLEKKECSKAGQWETIIFNNIYAKILQTANCMINYLFRYYQFNDHPINFPTPTSCNFASPQPPLPNQIKILPNYSGQQRL